MNGCLPFPHKKAEAQHKTQSQLFPSLQNRGTTQMHKVGNMKTDRAAKLQSMLNRDGCEKKKKEKDR